LQEAQMEDFIEEYQRRTPTSRRLHQEAQKVMAGGVSHGVRYFPPYPLYIKKVSGARIWDVDGNEYIDLWMGHFAMILGHRSELLTKALHEAVDLGSHWGIVHEHQVALARLICDMVPCAEQVRFCVSGTEATMYAARLARGFTGRRLIVKMEGGWHGANTDLCVAIRPPFDVPDSAGIPPETAQLTRAIPFNDVEAALRALNAWGSDLAGVIVEPVMGAAGIIPAERGFLEVLREETARLGALLIFDEVITGFRLAPGGAQQHYGVVPDLVTLGKIAGGGGNIGAVAGRSDVLARSDPTVPRRKGEAVMIGGGTFSCSPMSMISGLAVLRYLRDHAEEVYPRLNRLGQRLRKGMEDAFREAGLPGRAIGVGSLCGAYLPLDPDTVVRNAADMFLRTDLKRMEHEFRIRMLNQGVYTMHGAGAISTAHGEEEVDHVIRATRLVAEQMAFRSRSWS
jgi:glutamate-1-semialdehyde 2,1-aminomutase